MKSCGIYNNLKVGIQSKPPLIIFIFCLSSVAVLSLCVSLYVKNATLESGDITKDWNVFLDSLSMLEFCLGSSLKQDGYSSNISSSVPLPSSSSPQFEKHWRNYTVPMMMTILPTPGFVSIPHNLTLLNGLVDSALLGFKDVSADESSIEISLEIPFNWNDTRCEGMTCDEVKVYTCIAIRAHESALPHSEFSSQSCLPYNSSDFTLEYRMQMNAYMKTSRHKCSSQPIMWLKHDLDPALTVYLSLEDKSIINLHLLHTSFFLFVMVLMIFTVALFRGRAHKLAFESCSNSVHYVAEDKNIPLLREVDL